MSTLVNCGFEEPSKPQGVRPLTTSQRPAPSRATATAFQAVMDAATNQSSKNISTYTQGERHSDVENSRVNDDQSPPKDSSRKQGDRSLTNKKNSLSVGSLSFDNPALITLPGGSTLRDGLSVLDAIVQSQANLMSSRSEAARRRYAAYLASSAAAELSLGIESLPPNLRDSIAQYKVEQRTAENCSVRIQLMPTVAGGATLMFKSDGHAMRIVIEAESTWEHCLAAHLPALRERLDQTLKNMPKEFALIRRV